MHLFSLLPLFTTADSLSNPSVYDHNANFHLTLLSRSPKFSFMIFSSPYYWETSPALKQLLNGLRGHPLKSGSFASPLLIPNPPWSLSSGRHFATAAQLEARQQQKASFRAAHHTPRITEVKVFEGNVVCLSQQAPCQAPTRLSYVKEQMSRHITLLTGPVPLLGRRYSAGTAPVSNYTCER